MQRFFAWKISDHAAVFADEEEKRHASKVLRLRPGEEIGLICPDGLYAARYAEEEPLEIRCPLPDPEPLLQVTLYQGLPKGDKLDEVVKKCTQGGLHALRPVQMTRCVSRFRPEETDKKLARLTRIAREAVKQSGRVWTPEILTPLSSTELPNVFAQHGLVLCAWEEEHAFSLKDALLKAPDVKSIGLIIGPEGGISPEEAELFRKAGALPVTLGKRILRTEDAGFAALIALMTLTGNFA